MKLSDLNVEDTFYFKEGEVARYQQGKGKSAYTLSLLKTQSFIKYVVLSKTHVSITVKPIHSEVQYIFRYEGAVQSQAKATMDKYPEKYYGYNNEIEKVNEKQDEL